VPGRRAALPGADLSQLPVMLTEFGGIAFGKSDQTWGYATAADAAEFEQTLRALVAAVRSRPEISGFVWTQLTDVQQEANGLLCFDRTPKLPVKTYHNIFAAT
jgi:hypothetical protein